MLFFEKNEVVYINIYMELAIKEAKKAYKNGDVPIGAVIVKNGKVISKAHNKIEKDNCATKHAEIIAIEKASKVLKTWRLDDCEMYVTMEPCMMCTGAIVQSRIKKIYYSVDNENFGYINNIDTKKIKVNKGIEKEKSIQLLRGFFKSKR